MSNAVQSTKKRNEAGTKKSIKAEPQTKDKEPPVNDKVIRSGADSLPEGVVSFIEPTNSRVCNSSSGNSRRHSEIINVRKACAMLQNCRGNLKSFLLAFARSSTPRTSVEWMLSPSRMGLIRRMPVTTFPLPTPSLSRLKAIPDPLRLQR